MNNGVGIFFKNGRVYAHGNFQAKSLDEIERICADIARNALEDPSEPCTYHIFGAAWRTEMHPRGFPILRFVAPVYDSPADGLIRRDHWVGMSSFFPDLEKKEFRHQDDESAVLYLMDQPKFACAIEEVRRMQAEERARRGQVLKTRREETLARLRQRFNRLPPRDPDDKTPVPFSVNILFDEDGYRFEHKTGMVFKPGKTTGGEDHAIYIVKCPPGHELAEAYKKNPYAIVSLLYENEESEPLEQDGEAWRERMILRNWLRNALKEVNAAALGGSAQAPLAEL